LRNLGINSTLTGIVVAERSLLEETVELEKLIVGGLGGQVLGGVSSSLEFLQDEGWMRTSVRDDTRDKES
jgi:hypothetical protein